MLPLLYVDNVIVNSSMGVSVTLAIKYAICNLDKVNSLDG